jgi:polygalacturonase
MTIDNVTIDTDRDGMDLDCCRNAMVSNCRVNSPRDDGICPKSSFALGRNVITENLTIINCQVSAFQEGTLVDGTMRGGGGTGRIKFGTEANGGFRNVTVANCTFRACHGLALEEVDGGIMENITINNITMMDVAGYPIYITTGKRNRGPNVTQASRARNIHISNIIATGIAGSGGGRANGIEIFGLPDAPIEGVRLENIRLQFRGGGTTNDAAVTPRELGTGYPEPSGIMPGYGLFARHVKGQELASITVGFDTVDLRPALVGVDLDGVEIDNVKAQLAPGVAAARWTDVKGLTVRNSPGIPGAEVK